MIIYNHIWSILIQLIRVVIVRWQSDQVNTKESVLPVGDKPCHMNKRNVQKVEEIEVLLNYALAMVLYENINFLYTQCSKFISAITV